MGKPNKAAEARIDVLERNFPGWKKEVWDRKAEVGYTTVPRTLGLITALLKQLCKGGDPSSVYVELWCRVYDEGLVEVRYAKELGVAAGFSPARAERSFRERVKLLRNLGFVKTAKRYDSDFDYIFLRHPDIVVRELEAGNKLPSSSWTEEYARRMQDIGAVKRKAPIREIGNRGRDKIVKVPISA